MSGLPSTAARERTAEVLRHVGLYEERYRAIGGYSTGMKQRVKLAQALVHDPRLLLLDEPTNGLDPAGRDEMLALVRRTGTEFGIAVVVASHLLGEIERVCDFLVAIDAGRLLRAAPLGSFTERTGVLAVEVEEGEDALAGALWSRTGCRPSPTAARSSLRVTEDAQYDVVRDAVAELGLPLVRLRAAPPEPRGPVPRRRPAPAHRARRRPRRQAGAVPAPTRRRDRAASGPGGSIYDLGYQAYTGPRLGRRSAVRRCSRRRSGRASGSVAAGAPRSHRSRWRRWRVLPAVLAVGIAALAAQAGPAQLDRRLADPLRDVPRARRHPDHAVLRARRHPSCSGATSATASCRCTSRAS